MRLPSIWRNKLQHVTRLHSQDNRAFLRGKPITVYKDREVAIKRRYFIVGSHTHIHGEEYHGTFSSPYRIYSIKICFNYRRLVIKSSSLLLYLVRNTMADSSRHSLKLRSTDVTVYKVCRVIVYFPTIKIIFKNFFQNGKLLLVKKWTVSLFRFWNT